MSQSNGNGNGNGAGSVRVEIYDQTYHLRGSDPEYIGELADYVDTKMRLISKQAATVDSLRVAVLAASEYRRRVPHAEAEVRLHRDRLQRAGRTTGGRAG